MREIKFRAWNKATEAMNNYVEIYSYKDGSTGCSAGLQNNNPIGNTENFILMQYTGLKDKNGKEIYEGDIVVLKTEDYDKINGVVSYDRGCFMCLDSNGDFIEFWDDGSYTSYHLGFLDESDIEVIGNVYENKELLK